MVSYITQDNRYSLKDTEVEGRKVIKALMGKYKDRFYSIEGYA